MMESAVTIIFPGVEALNPTLNLVITHEPLPRSWKPVNWRSWLGLGWWLLQKFNKEGLIINIGAPFTPIFSAIIIKGCATVVLINNAMPVYPSTMSRK